MTGQARSELPCPICGAHALALDEPPRIDVMGVQLYSDIVGMGDLAPADVPGIVCLECGTRWRDRDAFDRGEPEMGDEAEGTDAGEAAELSDDADTPPR